MPEQDKIPKVLRETLIRFDGDQAGFERFFRLEDWEIERANGTRDHQIIWRRGDFVVVVAMGPKGIVLVQEHKIAAGQTIWGLPAGSIKKGETPLEAALRELRQETGYEGDVATANMLGPYLNSPDKSTERHFVVVFWDAKKVGEAELDATESILEAVEYPIERASSPLSAVLHIAALTIVERSDAYRWRRAVARSKGVQYRTHLFGTIEGLHFMDCACYLAAGRLKHVTFRHELDGYHQPTGLRVTSTDVVDCAKGPWLVHGTIETDLNRPGQGESAWMVADEVVIECWSDIALVYPAKGYTLPVVPDTQ